MTTSTIDELRNAGLLEGSDDVHLTDKGRAWLHTLERLGHPPSAPRAGEGEFVYLPDAPDTLVSPWDAEDLVSSCSGLLR